ncbi:PilW family protein [Chitinibacter sp. GC72]|uniref:PilW family protein n=1 Tax=Chitinibacter sp. GC72 TaxID=1526917 RepID=UPI0012FCED6C|nr:prepilin-type N-terminal cleavage/methylation domain-containing protein [Chitinibacter sp. GC72]
MLKNKGFTLVELLISTAIGLLILFGVLTMFIVNLSTSRQQTDQIKLTQQLRSTMDIMSSEIRRAGYWANAKNQIANSPAPTANTNPFYTIDTSDPTCIVFAYDQNTNGTLQSNEIFGFKYENGTILVRIISTDTEINCSSSTGWQAITDPNKINVTGLTFSLNSQTCYRTNGATNAGCIGTATNSVGVAKGATTPITAKLESRAVIISIFAELVNDSKVQGELIEEVRIRNDQLRF